MFSALYSLFFTLLHFPDVVGFEKFSEVVILLCCLYLFYLLVDGIVVGGSIDIANDTEGYREAIAITHEGEFELEGVILAVSIMHEDVFLRDTILAYLDNLQAKAFLHQSELTILTEDEGFAMLYVDGILSTTSLVINRSMSTIIEDYAVLQHLNN